MVLKIVNTIFKVLFFVTGGTGLIQTLFNTPLSNIAFWRFTWGQIIIGMFVLSAFYVYAELEISNRRLRKAKPAIATTIPPYPDNYSLEIKNIGGDGEFQAEIEVIEGAQNLMEKILKFPANWEDTDQIQRPLLSHEAKRIKIARLVDDGTHIQLCSRNLQNNKEYYIRAYSDIPSPGQTQTPSGKQAFSDVPSLFKLQIDPDPKFKLQITIYAVGGLIDGKPFKRMYSLSLKGLEIVTQ
jgi:hypothetical protein